jgi:hypothetical protein
MTLYAAWSSGKPWVIYRGLLCLVSLPPAYGFGSSPDTFWVSHLGHWRKPRSRFCANVHMDAECTPCEPNSLLFRKMYRE